AVTLKHPRKSVEKGRANLPFFAFILTVTNPKYRPFKGLFFQSEMPLHSYNFYFPKLSLRSGMNRLVSFLATFTLLILSGCALVPPEPVVTGPLTAVPPTPAAVAAQSEPNGSIFQPTSYGNFPLFEDRRPRNVGDIVTVVIQEKTNAAKNVSTATDRKGSASLGLDAVPKFFPPGMGPDQSFDMSGDNVSQGRGSSSAANNLRGTITTTVIAVLPNGNLQIAGNKEMAINRGSEYVRFSGVVDPRSITGSNTVLSTQVADARIEYRSKGTMA